MLETIQKQLLNEQRSGKCNLIVLSFRCFYCILVFYTPYSFLFVGQIVICKGDKNSVFFVAKKDFAMRPYLCNRKTKNNMKIAEVILDETNLEQQKAFDLVANTNTSLFITGKAGTGKTTFIKGIQEQIKKSFLVLAPTGIAAMNVGGQTIHSFFGLPFEAIGLETKMEVSLEKRKTLEHIDTIIIDEASLAVNKWCLSAIFSSCRQW